MIRYKTEKIISVNDWDNLVKETYGKPYSFQQQDGCKSRGIERVEFDPNYDYDEFMDVTSIKVEVNGEEMGVSFDTWINTDTKAFESLLNDERPSFKGAVNWKSNLFWQRNFYPDINMVGADLCKRGLIEPGKYIIEINW